MKISMARYPNRIPVIRHPNRKYYMYSGWGGPGTPGTYVNISEIAELTKMGNSFDIREKSTGRDLTNEVLASAIATQTYKNMSEQELINIIRTY